MENESINLVPAFGGIDSPKDYRDINQSDVAASVVLPQQAMVDNLDTLPVWNQKSIGSCTGHAGAKYGQDIKLKSSPPIKPFSARWAYGMAKCMDNVAGEGTYPRLIAQIFQKYGMATEATVPNNCDLDHETYVYNRQLANIPKTAFDEAINHKIKSYVFVDNIPTTADGLKQAVVQSRGAMLLVRLGSEWWKNTAGVSTWNEKDLLPLRPPATVVSGHEIYLTGYVDVTDADIVNMRSGKITAWDLYAKYSKTAGQSPDVTRTRTVLFFLNSWSNLWAHNGFGCLIYDEYVKYLNEAITFVDLPDSVLEELKTLPAPGKFRHVFLTQITPQSPKSEISALQTALRILGFFPVSVAAADYGIYGPRTRAAVMAFQRHYNVATEDLIKQLNGNSVGPITRAKLNELINS